MVYVRYHENEICDSNKHSCYSLNPTDKNKPEIRHYIAQKKPQKKLNIDRLLRGRGFGASGIDNSDNLAFFHILHFCIRDKKRQFQLKKRDHIIVGASLRFEKKTEFLDKSSKISLFYRYF